MVVRSQKKMRRQRGLRWHGWGSKKKHRGAGSRGGRGFAGSMKHNKIWVMQNFPGHIGRTGFKSLGPKRKVINLSEVDNMTKGSEINLTKLGYTKLLSRGALTKPLKITVPAASEEAKRKVEEVGGKVELS